MIGRTAAMSVSARPQRRPLPRAEQLPAHFTKEYHAASTPKDVAVSLLHSGHPYAADVAKHVLNGSPTEFVDGEPMIHFDHRRGVMQFFKPKLKLAKVSVGPQQRLTPLDDARDYMLTHRGRPYVEQPSDLRVPDALSTRAAHWYEGAKDQHLNPIVQKSYKAYAEESLAQLKHLLARGIKVTPMKSLDELYPTSHDMRKDVHENRHLKYLPTALGWGDGTSAPTHPMLAPTGLHTEDGTPILYNDAFRIIHDWYGHGVHPHSFGSVGEGRAWHQHARMYSPEARPAMTYETFGQTRSYFHGSQKHLPISERKFPEQKASLFPRKLMPKVKLAKVGPVNVGPLSIQTGSGGRQVILHVQGHHTTYHYDPAVHDLAHRALSGDKGAYKDLLRTYVVEERKEAERHRNRPKPKPTSPPVSDSPRSSFDPVVPLVSTFGPLLMGE